MKHHELESREDKKKEKLLEEQRHQIFFNLFRMKEVWDYLDRRFPYLKKLLFHQYFWCKLNSQDDLTNYFG